MHLFNLLVLNPALNCKLAGPWTVLAEPRLKTSAIDLNLIQPCTIQVRILKTRLSSFKLQLNLNLDRMNDIVD